MLWPIAIFIVCLGVGVTAASRWLPDLSAGLVGGLSFFVVCGLVGGAVGLVGLHIYSIVDALNHFGGSSLGGPENGEIVASGIRSLLFEAGTLMGFAAAVYLLAPCPAELVEEPFVE